MAHPEQQRANESTHGDPAGGDLGAWHRWAPMVCVAIVAAGTSLGSPWVIWGAAATALMGGALSHHPVDYFYNHVVRRFTGTAPLAPNTRARKIASLMAASLLFGAGLAFFLQASSVGYVLGIATKLVLRLQDRWNPLAILVRLGSALPNLLSHGGA
jgi:hypothetical protein